MTWWRRFWGGGPEYWSNGSYRQQIWRYSWFQRSKGHCFRPISRERERERVQRRRGEDSSRRKIQNRNGMKEILTLLFSVFRVDSIGKEETLTWRTGTLAGPTSLRRAADLCSVSASVVSKSVQAGRGWLASASSPPADWTHCGSWADFGAHIGPITICGPNSASHGQRAVFDLGRTESITRAVDLPQFLIN